MHYWLATRGARCRKLGHRWRARWRVQHRHAERNTAELRATEREQSFIYITLPSAVPRKSIPIVGVGGIDGTHITSVCLECASGHFASTAMPSALAASVRIFAPDSFFLHAFIAPLVLPHLISRFTSFSPSFLQYAGLSILFFFAIPNTCEELMRLKQKRAARRLGARLPPRVKTWLPGNLDMVIGNLRGAKYQEPGDRLVPYLEKHGNVINLRVFGSDIYFTAEPNDVKHVSSVFLAHCIGLWAC